MEFMLGPARLDKATGLTRLEKAMYLIDEVEVGYEGGCESNVLGFALAG